MKAKIPPARFCIPVLAALCLQMPWAAAQTTLTAPAGYQPGWQITVYKAGRDLTQPSGSRLTSFLAPASGFDMASYRDTLQTSLNYGLLYDAEGLLNIGDAGVYRLGVRLDWNPPEPGAPEAHCSALLSVDGATQAEWSGSVSTADGHQAADGGATLQPGLHPAKLHLACDQPLGAGLRIAALIKAPADADLRRFGAADLLHPASGGNAGGAVAVAPQAAPPRQTSLPPSPVYGPPAASGDGLVATIDLSIRERPDRRSRRLGRIPAGQKIDIGGQTSDPAWVQLASGGYVEAGFLKPEGQAAPPRPTPAAGRASGHKVGDCRPYQMPAAVGGRTANISGEACLQANGTWRIVR